MMVFPVTFRIIRPEKGNPRRIKACISQTNGNLMLPEMGTFKYYQFLRDMFEDLSVFHRIGNLAFVKPGLGDLCISWAVIETMSKNDIEESVIDAIENLNRIHIQKYQAKYSLLKLVPFELIKGSILNADSFQLNLKIEIQHSERISVTAN